MLLADAVSVGQYLLGDTTRSVRRPNIGHGLSRKFAVGILLAYMVVGAVLDLLCLILGG